MTKFDTVIDIAMISINDYKLDKSAEAISEENFSLLQSSSDYNDYVTKCENNTPNFIPPVSSKRYDYIISQDYVDYDAYTADGEKQLTNRLDAFLIAAIPNFENCTKLEDIDYDNRVFNQDLTSIEISILADLVELAWYERENNDTRQFTAMIQNKSEANRYSEGNLLKERNAREMGLREKIDTKKAKYDLKNNFKRWEF